MTYLDEIKTKGQDANPFFRLMGINPESFGEGKACLSMPVRPDMHNGEGWLQGGIYTALADEAMALAIYTVLAEGEMIATISFTTTFLRGVRDGAITGEAEIVRKGRQVIFCEAVIRSDDPQRTECARCSASFIIR